MAYFLYLVKVNHYSKSRKTRVTMEEKGVQALAKSKYESHVEPYLDKIAEWARAGATAKEIAKKLHVSYSCFRKYVDLGQKGDERYKALASSFAQACEVADGEVEAALFRRACGYQYEEKTVEEKLDRNGDIHKLIKIVKRDVPPDPTSAMFWLTNRQPQRWKYKPEGQQEDDGETGVIEIGGQAEEPTPPERLVEQMMEESKDG